MGTPLKTGSKNAPSGSFRSPPDIIERERSKNSSKTKAREPHKPLTTSTKKGS